MAIKFKAVCTALTPNDVLHKVVRIEGFSDLRFVCDTPSGTAVATNAFYHKGVRELFYEPLLRTKLSNVEEITQVLNNFEIVIE